jgi:protein-S-isoprenylcysteine O-methyltransferase Ste14
MNGPFRYIRHPFYLSYCLTFLAGALSAAWWPAWLMAFLMGVFYFSMALAEERHLLTAHADTYARYRLATGAFIPRILVPSRDAV